MERFSERLDSLLAVKPFALHPAALAVGPEKQVKLMVSVYSRIALMVLVAQSNRAAFPFADWPAAAWIDVVAFRIRAVTDEAPIVYWIQAWLLIHLHTSKHIHRCVDVCLLRTMIYGWR
jgi:hypothetical protein